MIIAKQCEVARKSLILDGCLKKYNFLDTHLVSTIFLATLPIHSRYKSCDCNKHVNYFLLYSDTDRVEQWANHQPASGKSNQTGAEQRKPERGGLPVSDQGSG